MNVILCEDVDNLGDMGETVRVAPGYARNFLLPRRLAVMADSASARQIEHEMRIIRKREVKRREELAEVAKGIEGLKLTFTAKAGAEGKLFGSITNVHISTKLQEAGHAVNRRKIGLTEPIKSLGEHDVTVTLTSGITATIKIVVGAEAPDLAVGYLDDEDDREVKAESSGGVSEEDAVTDETAEDATKEELSAEAEPEVKTDESE